jgi:hypothetical protein
MLTYKVRWAIFPFYSYKKHGGNSRRVATLFYPHHNQTANETEKISSHAALHTRDYHTLMECQIRTFAGHAEQSGVSLEPGHEVISLVLIPEREMGQGFVHK